MLASRSLFLGAKDKLYSLCDCKIMLNESETLAFKEEKGVMRLERNDGKMGTWMSNVGAGDGISAKEFRTRPIEQHERIFARQKTSVLWSPGKNGRWKRMLGLVYFKPSRLVVVSPEDTLRKNEMR